MNKISLFAIALLLAATPLLVAQNTDVTGGQTSVLLDTDLLSTVGLDLSGVSDDVGMGNLGDASVAFDINPRDAVSQPTTFSYTVGDFAPFEGTVEHTGSVFFNMDMIEVGNFSIGFDENRIMGDNSGFFVESTTGLNAILFDVGLVTELDPAANSLTIAGSLLVSPELATFLNNGSLAGVDVGDALVEGTSAIPEPSTALLLSMLGLAIAGTRYRA